MRITHVAALHPPRDARIYQRECRSLAEAGHEVTLVAPEAETIEDDRLRTVGLPPLRLGKGKAALARALLRSHIDAWKATRRMRPDVFHFHEVDMIPIMLLHRLRGIRIVYDVHEDVPKQIVVRCKRFGLPGAALMVRSVYVLAEWLARRLFQRFICATEPIAKRFPPGRTVVVRNYPRLETIDEAVGEAPERPFNERPRQVIYAGGIARDRCAWEMIDAIAMVGGGGARLRLLGPMMTPGLESELSARPGWSNVDYEGKRPHAEVYRAFTEVRAGLVLISPLPPHFEAMPTKMFEYMAAGLPVIASDFPLWRKIIDDAGCGLLVDPMDPAAIAGAVQYLMDHPDEAEAMGRRGREAAHARYSWASEESTLLRMYEELAR